MVEEAVNKYYEDTYGRNPEMKVQVKEIQDGDYLLLSAKIFFSKTNNPITLSASYKDNAYDEFVKYIIEELSSRDLEFNGYFTIQKVTHTSQVIIADPIYDIK